MVEQDITMKKKKKKMVEVEALPLGYCFKLTDKELATVFLKKKALGQNLPTQFRNTIIERNLYGDQKPWEIFDRDHYPVSDEFYVFTKIKKKFNGGGKVMDRTVGDGTWKIESTDEVFDNDRSTILGFKRVLNFWDPFAKKKKKNMDKGNTHWIMHEYTLNDESSSGNREILTLCRIKRGKEPPKPSASASANTSSTVASNVADGCYSTTATKTTPPKKRPLDELVDDDHYRDPKRNRTSPWNQPHDHVDVVVPSPTTTSGIEDHHQVSSSLLGLCSNTFQPSSYDDDHQNINTSGEKSCWDSSCSFQQIRQYSSHDQQQQQEQQPVLMLDDDDDIHLLPSLKEEEWSDADLNDILNFDDSLDDHWEDENHIPTVTGEKKYSCINNIQQSSHYSREYYEQQQQQKHFQSSLDEIECTDEEIRGVLSSLIRSYGGAVPNVVAN